MTKVILNGNEIELKDELEKGEVELDLYNENIDLEDTLELTVITDSMLEKEGTNHE